MTVTDGITAGERKLLALLLRNPSITDDVFKERGVKRTDVDNLMGLGCVKISDVFGEPPEIRYMVTDYGIHFAKLCAENPPSDDDS